MTNAQPKQQSNAGCAQHFHHGKKHAECPNGPDVRLAMGCVDFRKRLSFHLLPIERLHDVHARHMLLDKFIDFGHLVANVHKGAFDVLLEHTSSPSTTLESA